MHERPLQKSLQKFAEENFSNKYYACLHGQTKKINLLALAVRRHRWPFTRPFAKSELIILDGLEKYMETKEAEKFRETLKTLMTSEEMAMQAKKLPLGARYMQFFSSKVKFAFASKCHLHDWYTL